MLYQLGAKEVAAFHECAHALYYLDEGYWVHELYILAKMRRGVLWWDGVVGPGIPRVRVLEGEEEAIGCLVGQAADFYWDDQQGESTEWLGKRYSPKSDIGAARAALGGDLVAVERAYAAACAWVEENAQRIASLTLELLEHYEPGARFVGLPVVRLMELAGVEVKTYSNESES